MATAHNAYASLEAAATVDGLRQALPDRRPFVLSRAGYAGIHRSAATWTGDAPSSWPTLQTTLPMMIGMSASGLFHVGSDVGGYSGRATPELFARWMQLGAISPFFRAHTATTGAPQEPWRFGQEVLDISRGLLAWRSALRPYLDSLNDEAIRTGAPILRPLAWEFPDDPALWSVGDEAMLGPWLLIAPVLDEGARTRAIRLPAGRWFELNTGAAVDGPTTVTWDVKLGTLPIYVREGAILPRDPPRAYADAPAEAIRYLDLWPANAPTAWTLYEDDGEGRAWESGALSRRQVELAPTAAGVTVTLAPATGTWRWPERTLALVLHRIDHAPTAVRVDGAEAADWTWDPAALSLTVRAPDRDGLRVEIDVERALLALAPPVVMPFWVDVPPGTPTDTPMTVAADVDGWVFHPLTWSADGTHATGALTVPRGVWFEYKYQRGSWETVEKWPACEEAANRYEQGRAAPKRDRVWAWRDQCP
jgi:alpha-glucosidase